MDARVAALLEGMTAWAAERHDVPGVLLTGSQARTEEPADELTDVDLVLLVEDPEAYLADDDWVRAFGSRSSASSSRRRSATRAAKRLRRGEVLLRCCAGSASCSRRSCTGAGHGTGMRP